MNETRRTEWIAYDHYGFTHYRIWMQKAPHGFFQRHEWKREDGSIDIQDWIPTTAGFNATMAPYDILET